jgi:hypothetical protein
LSAAAEVLKRNDLDAAEASFRALLADHADLPEAHAGLSTVLRKRGRRKEANATFRQALALKAAELGDGTRLVTLQEKANHFASIIPLGREVEQFERVGRMQFNTLIRNGLYPSHSLLELDCGALGGGYFAIHYLNPGRYFGIDANRSHVRLGVDHFLEPGLVAEKRPRFDVNDAYDFSVFGAKFDFVFARSLWTRLKPAQIRAMLDGFAAHATEQGVFLTSYWNFGLRFRSAITGKRTKPEPSLDWIHEQCLERDLVVWELNDELTPAHGQVWLRIQRQS